MCICFVSLSYKDVKALKPKHIEMEKEKFMLALLFEIWVQVFTWLTTFFGLITVDLWIEASSVEAHGSASAPERSCPILDLKPCFIPLASQMAAVETQGKNVS